MHAWHFSDRDVLDAHLALEELLSKLKRENSTAAVRIELSRENISIRPEDDDDPHDRD